MQISQIVIPLALAVIFSSCDILGLDDEDAPRVSRVIVANGGNFSDQNGNITSFDPSTSIVDQLPVMSGFLHGIAEHEGNFYALLNTFTIGRVDVLNNESLSISGQIDGVTAPRSIDFTSDTAYITSLELGSNGHVTVVSLESGSIVKTIEVGAFPEGIIISQSMLYVANMGNLGSGNTISIIDTGTDVVDTRSIPCDGPSDIFGGDGDDIIIACTGKTEYNDDYSEILEQTNGSVLFYDASLDVLKGKIELDVQLVSTNGTGVGTHSESNGELYVIDGSTNTVFRIDVTSRRIRQKVKLNSELDLMGISGIAYDNRDELLYVGRFPKSSAGAFPDYTSSGTVEIYDRNFELTDSFLAGVAISQILLLESK